MPLHRALQVLKTEDLPRWPGAAFDSNAVLDNAHALLSFLHAHCTRPGGSYWVLREPGLTLTLAPHPPTLDLTPDPDPDPGN